MGFERIEDVCVRLPCNTLEARIPVSIRFGGASRRRTTGIIASATLLSSSGTEMNWKKARR